MDTDSVYRIWGTTPKRQNVRSLSHHCGLRTGLLASEPCRSPSPFPMNSPPRPRPAASPSTAICPSCSPKTSRPRPRVGLRPHTPSRGGPNIAVARGNLGGSPPKFRRFDLGWRSLGGRHPGRFVAKLVSSATILHPPSTGQTRVAELFR